MMRALVSCSSYGAESDKGLMLMMRAHVFALVPIRQHSSHRLYLWREGNYRDELRNVTKG